IQLDAAVVGQFAWPKPSHIGEISRIVFDESKARCAVNPAAVGERQRHVLTRKRVDRLFIEPVCITKLDGESRLRRQQANEVAECGLLVWREIGWKLDQHASQFVFKQVNALDELFEDALAISQAILMSNFRRQLQGKVEARRRALCPTFNRILRWNRIKG